MAVTIAVAVFCLAGGAIFYSMSAKAGGLHGGPATLTAAMAGLFLGGLAGLLALILSLRWLPER